jgi:hypothetical protein
MLVKVTVEILADEESEKAPTTGAPICKVCGETCCSAHQPKNRHAIAEGIIVGALDITRGSGEHSTKPLLTVKMRNILTAVQQQIFADSNAPEV